MTPKYLAISNMSKKIALRQRRFRIAGQREEHGYLTVGQLRVNDRNDSLNSYRLLLIIKRENVFITRQIRAKFVNVRKPD